MTLATAMDHQFWNRIAEGSPLIVLILLGGVTLLWRALREEQKAREALQRETLTALAGFTKAVDRLTGAIEDNRRT